MNIFLTKFCLMIILMMIEIHFDAPSRFRKGWTISIQKKQWINKYFDKKNRGLVNWGIDVTNKINNGFSKSIFCASTTLYMWGHAILGVTCKEIPPKPILPPCAVIREESDPNLNRCITCFRESWIFESTIFF